MKEAGVVLLAYLIGSIPAAYLLGRGLKSIDIRQYGSGNVGASNIWVHVGKWLVIPLGAFDLFVKGSLPVYLAQRLDTSPWIAVAAGLATVAGHNWSLYLKLTGGRGVTVALGVLLVLAWKELLALVLVALAGYAIFRSSALWVGIGVALLPAWSVVFGEPTPVTVLCVSLVAVVSLKRLVSNHGTAMPGTPWRKRYLHRLLYDRDISSRDEWVYRTPPGVQKDV
ncbi:MAG: glycerol-3-phosphate acyltransferase [Chloroflexi bacterium]|nr:glycerol-3-phosphate acyltransferase [Chloroflexota bacterium]